MCCVDPASEGARSHVRAAADVSMVGRAQVAWCDVQSVLGEVGLCRARTPGAHRDPKRQHCRSTCRCPDGKMRGEELVQARVRFVRGCTIAVEDRLPRHLLLPVERAEAGHQEG